MNDTDTTEEWLRQVLPIGTGEFLSSREMDCFRHNDGTPFRPLLQKPIMRIDPTYLSVGGVGVWDAPATFTCRSN